MNLTPIHLSYSHSSATFIGRCKRNRTDILPAHREWRVEKQARKTEIATTNNGINLLEGAQGLRTSQP
jgi:hypothetical protein